MDDSFVNQSTCNVAHEAVDRRIDRVEKDTDKQWNAIDDLRKMVQKQAINIAFIVGGVSAVVQFTAIMIQMGLFKH